MGEHEQIEAAAKTTSKSRGKKCATAVDRRAVALEAELA